MKSYKICVYAICKNEEKFVDRWMDSMSEADLVVVTDTGSDDGTVEKLRERGADVYIDKIQPWRFDAARNVSLEHIPDDVDICVCTDLDEVFNPGWREKLEASWSCKEPPEEKPVARRGKYLYNWSLSPDGTPDVQFVYSKVHERHGFCWVWPVHEYIRYDGNLPLESVFIDGMTLNHYPDPSKPRSSYLSLLELAVEEAPMDDRMRYYLGREYMYKGQWQKCIDTLTIYLLLPTAVWNEERCAAMRWLAESCLRLGRTKDAYGWFYKAIAEAPCMRDPYVEFSKMCYELNDWPMTLFLAEEALKIKEKSATYINMGYAWDHTPDDLCAIAAYHMNLMEKALEYARSALSYAPDNERLQNNLRIIEALNNNGKRNGNNTVERLIHTLLFLLREDAMQEDLERAEKCLKSLEKSTYNTVIVFNQGFWDNDHVENYLKQFRLDCVVIGDGTNKGIVEGRQSCFEYIWQNFAKAEFITELHLDMIFTFHWEDTLVDYLTTHDEPLISCGIVDKSGALSFLDTAAETTPENADCMDDYLEQLKRDTIVYGFTHPCVHKSDVLKKVGGYDTHFLKGKQAFEDDSLLLGYHYYYGTRANWRPKVSYQSVVYHEVAGQRIGINDSILINYMGLVRQYGAMGLKHLALLHQSAWHIQYFTRQFYAIKNGN